MNPLDLLRDTLPPWARKWVFYFIIPIAVFVYGVWQASGGDWAAFWPALVTAIIGLLVAHPNTGEVGDGETEVEDADEPVPVGTGEDFSLSDAPATATEIRAPAPVSTYAEANLAASNAVADVSIPDPADPTQNSGDQR